MVLKIAPPPMKITITSMEHSTHLRYGEGGVPVAWQVTITKDKQIYTRHPASVYG